MRGAAPITSLYVRMAYACTPKEDALRQERNIAVHCHAVEMQIRMMEKVLHIILADLILSYRSLSPTGLPTIQTPLKHTKASSVVDGITESSSPGSPRARQMESNSISPLPHGEYSQSSSTKAKDRLAAEYRCGIGSVLCRAARRA